MRLLGRDFVAFRASDGRLGFFDEGCPHRAASLVLARNEDCALRCVLHGWKMDVSGQIVEMPNEAGVVGDKKFAAHYPIREAGGMVWVWIGEGEPAPFPEFPFADCEPEVQVKPVAAYFNCNYMQLMETLWDPAHVGILHGTGETMKKAWGDANPELAANASKGSIASTLSASGCQVTDERWGFRYQFGGEGGMAGRGTVPTVMPSWIFIGALGVGRSGRPARVRARPDRRHPHDPLADRVQPRAGVGRHREHARRRRAQPRRLAPREHVPRNTLGSGPRSDAQRELDGHR